MRIQVAKGEIDWVGQVSHWVHQETESGQRVFLPAGGTPSPVYRHWVANPSPHLHSLKFVQIDDVMDGPLKGTFKKFFATEMKPYLAQFEWIEAGAGQADVAILGVGINGHVAFHEPGLPRDFYSGCVPLSHETLGYLALVQPTWGLTYGVASFLRCRKILVLARGPRKQSVLRAAAGLPIGWILEHPNVTLISDFDL